MASLEQSDPSFLSLALSQQVVLVAIKVALIVGTLLALINHADKILTLSLSPQNLLQILLTYLVPYCVSTWSAVKALRNHSPR